MGFTDGPSKDHHHQPPSTTPPDNLQEKCNKRKRAEREETRSNDVGIGLTLALLQQPDLPTFNLVSERKPQTNQATHAKSEARGKEWQTVGERPAKKSKKIPKAHSSNYPSISFSSEARLQSQIKISDLQNLVLYLLADGTGPQWISVRHRPEIRKVVVLMIPGLEKDMFKMQLASSETSDEVKPEKECNYASPDDYYPVKLNTEKLPPHLHKFAEMFEHLWPVKTPGDDKYSRMHSPLHAMLTAPIPRNQDEKKDKKGAKSAKDPHGWQNKRTPVTEFLATVDELLENDYTLHPAVYSDANERSYLKEARNTAKTSEEHGWVDSWVQSWEQGSAPDEDIESGSLTVGREIIAMDCEMCMTGEQEFSLTRISLVAWDGSVILDELVKPDKPIVNYVTQYVYPRLFLNSLTFLDTLALPKKCCNLLPPHSRISSNDCLKFSTLERFSLDIL
jgi:RNA exonuclease 1